MAKEIIVRELCDVCLEDDEKVDGTAILPVYLSAPRGGLKPRVLALCDTHRAQYWTPLYDLLTRLGQPYDSEATMPAGPTTGTRPNSARGGTSNGARTRGAQFVAGPFKCEIPGCEGRRPSKNLSAFGQHLWALHRLNMTLYRQRVGEPRRVDGTPAYTYDETGRPVLYPHPANDEPTFSRRATRRARSADEESQDAAVLAEKVHADPPADDADPYACTVCGKYTGAGLKSPSAGLRSHMWAKHPERMRQTPLAG